MAGSSFRRFVRDREALDQTLFEAKQLACPSCRRTGMLIGHGLLMGYAEDTSDREVRGRRLLCSARFRRRGCGRTFSVLLATAIAGFVVRTKTLSRLLEAVVDGGCVKGAWEQLGEPLSLRSAYRLWTRLLAAQSHIRTALVDLTPTPASADQRPFAQVLAHLRRAVGAHDVLAGFQLSCQRGLFD